MGAIDLLAVLENRQIQRVPAPNGAVQCYFVGEDEMAMIKRKLRQLVNGKEDTCNVIQVK